MTIDKAIEKHRRIAETKKTLYDACILEEYNRHLLREYKEHEQLAEWLEELKAYIEIGTIEECRNSVLDIQKAYNKAIDDFVKSLQKLIEKELSNPMLMLECKKCGIWKNYNIEHIAEQLKAGGENEETD